MATNSDFYAQTTLSSSLLNTQDAFDTLVADFAEDIFRDPQAAGSATEPAAVASTDEPVHQPVARGRRSSVNAVKLKAGAIETEKSVEQIAQEVGRD